MDFLAFMLILGFPGPSVDTTELPARIESYMAGVGTDTTPHQDTFWRRIGPGEISVTKYRYRGIVLQDSEITYGKLDDHGHTLEANSVRGQSPMVEGTLYTYSNGNLVQMDIYDSAQITFSTKYAYSHDTLVLETMSNKGGDTGSVVYTYFEGKLLEKKTSFNNDQWRERFAFSGANFVERAMYYGNDDTPTQSARFELVDGRINKRIDFLYGMQIGLTLFHYSQSENVRPARAASRLPFPENQRAVDAMGRFHPGPSPSFPYFP
jgi:hypothetical protein